jgi:predicted CopG family antitoxin
MSKQITLDDDVFLTLVHKAIELNMVFSSANDVLRVVLNVKKQDIEMTTDNYPNSKVPEIQNLLSGLKDTIFAISQNGMKYHGNNRRWVANPNTVTITVQDARSRNLRITVYGRPQEFENIFGGLKSELVVTTDMAGYSRFILKNEDQLPYAIKVIQHSYNIKKERGRL